MFLLETCRAGEGAGGPREGGNPGGGLGEGGEGGRGGGGGGGWGGMLRHVLRAGVVRR